MKSIRAGAAGLLFASLAAVSFVPPALAQELNSEAFLEACNGNQDFLANLAAEEGGAERALDRLCTCLLTELGDVSQTDLDLLGRDLDGSATDDERMAYGTYEDLSQHAGTALNNCLVIEGFKDGADPAETPAETPAQ